MFYIAFFPHSPLNLFSIPHCFLHLILKASVCICVCVYIDGLSSIIFKHYLSGLLFSCDFQYPIISMSIDAHCRSPNLPAFPLQHLTTHTHTHHFTYYCCSIVFLVAVVIAVVVVVGQRSLSAVVSFSSCTIETNTLFQWDNCETGCLLSFHQFPPLLFLYTVFGLSLWTILFPVHTQ